MRAKSRDEQFQEAYPDLFSLAYRTAFRVGGDRTEAQDLAQEALTRAYVHWSKLDERRQAWIVTTTVRLAIDRWRRQQRQPSSDGTVDGAVDAIAAERLDLLRVLSRLPRRQREVATLRYLEDWPVRDVAAALGCSEGSVKRHASRASAALRAALAVEPLTTTEAP